MNLLMISAAICLDRLYVHCTCRGVEFSLYPPRQLEPILSFSKFVMFVLIVTYSQTILPWIDPGNLIRISISMQTQQTPSRRRNKKNLPDKKKFIEKLSRPKPFLNFFFFPIFPDNLTDQDFENSPGTEYIKIHDLVKTPLTHEKRTMVGIKRPVDTSDERNGKRTKVKKDGSKKKSATENVTKSKSNSGLKSKLKSKSEKSDKTKDKEKKKNKKKVQEETEEEEFGIDDVSDSASELDSNERGEDVDMEDVNVEGDGDDSDDSQEESEGAKKDGPGKTTENAKGARDLSASFISLSA